MKNLWIKIAGNIAVALLSSLFLLIWKSQQVIQAIQTGFYNEGYTGYPDYPVENFIDILKRVYHYPKDLFLLSIMFLILILMPFALFKNDKYNRGKTLTFIQKWLTLSIPLCIIAFFVFGGYLIISQVKQQIEVLLLLPMGFSLYLNILLHFTVDIWVYNNKKIKHGIS